MLRVHCARESGLTPADIARSSLFCNWVDAFDPRWELLDFYASSGHVYKSVVRMLFAEVILRNPEGQTHSRLVFLRGGTVDVLTILITPDGKKFVAHIEEERVAIGRTFRTNPAGMVDGGEVPVLAAIRERGEEVDREKTAAGIRWSTPFSLNEKILGYNLPMMVSPGGTDEGVFFYITTAAVSYRQLEALEGATGGLAEENELTTTRITPIERAIEALTMSGKAADLKAVASLSFYLA